MSQISLVVVDGQYTFADALSSRLQAEDGLLVVAATDSVTAARRVLVGRKVDVIMLDNELPESIQFAAELTRSRPHGQPTTRVILLGNAPEAARIVTALRAGVTGWVLKDESMEHLLTAILFAMRGQSWLPARAVDPVIKLLLSQSDQERGPQQHPLAGLTPREREVLSHLANGVGRLEVAERMHLSTNTVRSHLQNLMGKLNVHSALEAVAIARQAEPAVAGGGRALPRGRTPEPEAAEG
jgi:DNA-binding NarL/FixJ family response regulator